MVRNYVFICKYFRVAAPFWPSKGSKVEVKQLLLKTSPKMEACLQMANTKHMEVPMTVNMQTLLLMVVNSKVQGDWYRGM